MKRAIGSAVFVIAVAVLNSSCAGMMKQYRQTYCNYDGAYKKGAMDFEEKGKMDPGSMYPCDGATKAESERGYRDGYKMARGGGGITINLGSEYGGGAHSDARKKCLSAYGQKKCGYDCKQSYGKLECGKSPGDNCVAAFGQIRCGENCRENFGKIECD